MQFIADDMLGSLARWLRIMGYDTRYAAGASDDEIIEMAENEERIILTRDTDFADRSDAIILRSNDVEEQIGEVIEALSLEVPEEPQVRCTVCNGELQTVSKEEHRDEIPEGTFHNTDEFWECCECGHLYWRGSHWKRIRKLLERI